MKKITIIIEGDDCECEVVQLGASNSKKECPSSTSMYARFFDESCSGWTNDAEMNLTYLRFQQQYANERLRAQGYLFLNDVYDMLGMARTKSGQVVGWVYDEKNPMGDNYVDFDLYNEHNREFINGMKKTILLDFNVDGIILDTI